MLKIYKTENERIHEKLETLLGGKIKKTENGKPYIENGYHFSLTHTGDVALIAVSDSPVGIDAEKLTERKFSSIITRFTPRERAETTCTADFLKNWVVKEAYIKLIGGTLAHDLKRLEYFGGTLYCDGAVANCNIHCTSAPQLFFAVCAKSEIPHNIEILKL